MEEQIKRAVRNLNISYVFFWVLPAFLLGAGEFELFPVGGLVDNAPAIIVRLGVLEVAIVVNLLCYYLTLSSTGNLCMLIGLTASLFCLPSEKRLRNELHIAKEEKL